MNTESLWVVALLGLLGVLTHWLKQVAMMRQSTNTLGAISVRVYWLTYWPETITAFTSTVAGLFLLQELDYLTPVAAFGVGYLGNSVADLIGGRVQAMINAGRGGPPDAG